jgi:hypothetical protein
VTGHVLGGNAEDAAQLEQAVDSAAELAQRYIETGAFENWSSP